MSCEQSRMRDKEGNQQEAQSWDVSSQPCWACTGSHDCHVDQRRLSAPRNCEGQISRVAHSLGGQGPKKRQSQGHSPLWWGLLHLWTLIYHKQQDGMDKCLDFLVAACAVCALWPRKLHLCQGEKKNWRWKHSALLCLRDGDGGSLSEGFHT
jgi:hypothetical protein